jgi:hypothetical protein
MAKTKKNTKKTNVPKKATEPLPQSAGGPGDSAENPEKSSTASMPVFGR